MSRLNTIRRLNTFRLRLPNMYATIIAAKGDHSLSVCESRTSTNVTYTAACRGVSAYHSCNSFYFFIIKHKQLLNILDTRYS